MQSAIQSAIHCINHAAMPPTHQDPPASGDARAPSGLTRAHIDMPAIDMPAMSTLIITYSLGLSPGLARIQSRLMGEGVRRLMGRGRSRVDFGDCGVGR
eukprot:1606678-Prymnesium_polylepis.1